MATAEYVQNGAHIEFIAPQKTEYKEIVVIGARIGIAEMTLETGESGTLTVEGVFKLPAKSGMAIKQGQAVYWDDANQQIAEKSETTIEAGWAVEDKTEVATIVSVKIG